MSIKTATDFYRIYVWPGQREVIHSESYLWPELAVIPLQDIVQIVAV